MFNKILFPVFFLLGFNISYSQQGNISGTVTNEKNEPLPFANIGLSGTTIGVISDVNGFYKLSDLDLGEYRLIVSSVGYDNQTLNVKLSGRHLEIVKNVQLRQNIQSLEEIVVTGTMKEVSKLQSPVPVEIYSNAFFKSNPSPTVFESLQNINGVRPQVNCNVCNTGDIHINGLEGAYTMVLIDGMPIVSGLSTVYGLTGIPQGLIERLEIVKGPASALYGSEAVGGLINVITKTPDKAPIAHSDLFVTDWGELNADLGFKYKLGKKSSALSGINYFSYQNPQDNNNDGFTDLTLQNRVGFFNKISLGRKSSKRFDLAARYVYEDRWGGEMNWEPRHRGGEEVYGESITTNRWELYSTYDLPTAADLTFQISSNGHRQRSAYGVTVFDADQFINFGQLLWKKTIANHDLLIGGVYRHTFYDDNTIATKSPDGLSNKPSDRHLPGVFVQDELAISPRQRLLLGLRHDYNSKHGAIFTPRLNYKWNSNDQATTMRLGIGNGYRVVNIFTEDHASLTGAREVVFEEGLKPETSWNANFNFVKKKYTDASIFIGLDASAFYTYFFNKILPDYDSDPNKIIYGNLKGNAVSKGISANLDISFKNGLKGLVGLTVMDVSVEENKVKSRQILTESVQGVWSLGHDFALIGLRVDYTGNLYGPMRLPLLGDLDPRDEYSPWFSTQNIQIAKKIGSSWEIYGGAKNLLNFTPPANSIARPFDPFDKEVDFYQTGAPLPTDAMKNMEYADGDVIATSRNPNALSFDPTYVYAPNQGARFFFGIRLIVN